MVFYHTANLEVYERCALEKWREGIWAVARFVSPVECFFVISSFFLFKKIVLVENKKRGKIVVAYITRLIILYLIWSVLYIPNIIKNFYGRSLIHNVMSFIYQYAITGYSLQTWYMPSLLFGIIIVSYLFGYSQKEKLLFGAFVLSALILLCGKSYYYIVPQNRIIDWLINIGLISLVRSIPFVLIGVYFACKKELIGRRMDFVCWIFWGVCSIIEIQILKLNKWAISYDFYVCICPTVYFLMKNIIVKVRFDFCADIAKILGKMSTIIYFSHIAIRDLILAVYKGSEMNGFILWGMTFALSVLLAAVIVKLGKKWRVLKYLY